jgi:hypothetical protein
VIVEVKIPRVTKLREVLPGLWVGVKSDELRYGFFEVQKVYSKPRVKK